MVPRLILHHLKEKDQIEIQQKIASYNLNFLYVAIRTIFA